MKKFLFLLFAVLVLLQISKAQETFFQTGHTGGILEVHFSPDDSQLVSYSWDDGNFILWDVKSGRQIWTRETGFIRKAKENINLKEFYWSKDGKTIVTKSINETYQTWDAETGNILALSETVPEIELITPDKKTVPYTRDYENTTITDSETAKIFETYGTGNGFDTSNNGEMIAEGGGYRDGFVKITNIKSEEVSWLGAHPGIIRELKFSPDGNFLAVAGDDKNIYIFDAHKHILVKTLVGHQNPVREIVFSSDGKFLVSLASDDALKIRNWQDAEIVKNKESGDNLRFASKITLLDSDIKRILMQSSYPSFEIRDTLNWEVLREFKIKENSKDKKMSRTSILELTLPGSLIQISKNGKKIFADYNDGKIRTWDVNSAKLIREVKYTDNRNCRIKILSDEKRFLSFCPSVEKKRIQLFDLETGKVIKTYADADDYDDDISFSTQFIRTIEASPNGQYFLTSEITGDVWLWDVNKTKPIREFEMDFSGDDAIAFSPDGETFAVGGENQNVFLFETETGKKLWQLIPSYEPSKLEIQLEKKDK